MFCKLFGDITLIRNGIRCFINCKVLMNELTTIIYWTVQGMPKGKAISSAIMHWEMLLIITSIILGTYIAYHSICIQLINKKYKTRKKSAFSYWRLNPGLNFDSNIFTSILFQLIWERFQEKLYQLYQLYQLPNCGIHFFGLGTSLNTEPVSRILKVKTESLPADA